MLTRLYLHFLILAPFPPKYHFLYIYSCKGSFGGCQGQPSARPWHLLLRSLGLAALLSSSSVRLCTRGIAYPTHYHIVLFHRLPVIHARLACSLPYTLSIRLTHLE